MTSRTIAVVTAGLTTPSSTRLLADRLSAAVRDQLDGRGTEYKLEVFELRDLAHDLTNNLLTGFPSSALGKVLETVTAADGLIAVTPTFSASYNGLFKMFFDVLDDQALAGKPVLIAATGGTERHSLVLDYSLRPLFSYLKAIVIPTGVYAASSDWGTGATKLHTRIERAALELADAMSNERQAAADPTPTQPPSKIYSTANSHAVPHAPSDACSYVACSFGRSRPPCGSCAPTSRGATALVAGRNRD